MKPLQTRLVKTLSRLEEFYGSPKPPKSILPTLAGRADPYEMILYVICGYPATDVSCTKGFEALKKQVGLRPDDILAAPVEKLREVLRLGGIVPELRAERLREIAARVKHEFGGNLRAVLRRPLPEARKVLKTFPTIGDPGADKILLFTKTAPVAAVPSNCVGVTLRIFTGNISKNYQANYRAEQEIFRSELPQDCAALLRAHLLLKQHGQEICKRTRPLCERCRISSDCAYFRAARGER
jgi:endonuclease III